jgi:hypothetical protein
MLLGAVGGEDTTEAVETTGGSGARVGGIGRDDCELAGSRVAAELISTMVDDTNGNDVWLRGADKGVPVDRLAVTVGRTGTEDRET